MRRLLLLLTLVVMSAIAAHAQTESCMNLTSEPGAMFVGTYEVAILVPEPPITPPAHKPEASKKPAAGKKQTPGRKGADDRKPVRKGSQSKAKHKKGGVGGDNEAIVRIQVCVWRKEGGKFHIIQDAGSLSVTDSSSTIDTVTTASIMGVLARASIMEGVKLGLLSCSGSCTTMDSVMVSQSVCVVRSGSGSSTHLTVCGTGSYCSRNYHYCCSTPAMPTLIQVPSPGPVFCPSGPCQPTCN